MDLFPEGLSRTQFELLSHCMQHAEAHSLAESLALLDRKLASVRHARLNSAFVNVALAETLAANLKKLTDWKVVTPDHAKPWCIGAIHYFLQDCDAVPDFASPIGFEDDVEVFNACARLAGTLDLIIRPEDFDDA